MKENETEEVVVVTSKDKPVANIKDVRIVDIESEEGQRLAGDQPREVLPKAYTILRKIQACEIAKEHDKIVAKCGEKQLNLGTVTPEKAIENAETEECPGCSEAIAVGWAVSYIKPLNDLIANKIFSDVTDEKMTPDDAMDKCILVAQQHGKQDLVETLTHLKEIMHKPVAELEKEAGLNE